MIRVALSAMRLPSQPGACALSRRMSAASPYSGLPHLRKSILDAPERLVLAERGERAGEVRGDVSCGQHGPQRRPELPEPALGFGEGFELVEQRFGAPAAVRLEPG